MSSRPARHVPGRVDRTSRNYRLGAWCARVQIEHRPEHLGLELAEHEELIDAADDGTRIPFVGEYDLICGFAETVRAHLTQGVRS